MLDRIAAWLFRRYRAHMYLVLEVGSLVFLGVTVAPIAVVTVGFFFRFTSSEVCIIAAAGLAVIAIGNRLSIMVLRRQLAPARAWLRGEDVAPEAAWQTLLITVRSITTIAVLIIGPMLGTAIAGLVARYAHFGLAGWIGTELALLAALLSGTVLIVQAIHILWRPALEELVAQLPYDAHLPGRGLSIVARMGYTVTGVSMMGGVWAVAWSSRASSVEQRWLVGLVVAALSAMYLTFLFRGGLITPALRPLDDLLHATKRVRSGDLATPVPVTSADELGELAMAFNDMQRGLRDREALQNAFGSYVDPALARRLLDEGDAVFAGEEIDVSVFFADIRGFTGYAEQAAVSDAVATLNRFFSIAVRVISEHGGHTNAYLGDGLLAVFGTPLPLEDHADRAVAAALAVQQGVRAEFGESLHIGIGVNTGRVIAGTVGGEGKLEFTVIGDPVNVAARVEQLTKTTGDSILVTAATRDALTRVPESIVERGEFDVRGKARGVWLYSVG